MEARPSPEGALVVVSDDGAGVPDEVAEGSFDKFSPDASDGRGAELGLAIRGLMEAFGGRAESGAGPLVGFIPDPYS